MVSLPFVLTYVGSISGLTWTLPQPDRIFPVSVSEAHE